MDNNKENYEKNKFFTIIYNIYIRKVLWFLSKVFQKQLSQAEKYTESLVLSKLDCFKTQLLMFVGMFRHS